MRSEHRTTRRATLAAWLRASERYDLSNRAVWTMGLLAAIGAQTIIRVTVGLLS